MEEEVELFLDGGKITEKAITIVKGFILQDSLWNNKLIEMHCWTIMDMTDEQEKRDSQDYCHNLDNK